MIHNLYANLKSCVFVKGEKSEFFDSLIGVRKTNFPIIFMMVPMGTMAVRWGRWQHDAPDGPVQWQYDGGQLAIIFIILMIVTIGWSSECGVTAPL